MNKTEKFEAASSIMGIWAIMLAFELIVQSHMPQLESGTRYLLVPTVNSIHSDVFNLSPAGSASRVSDGEYVVEIDERLPEIGRNFILRHENCHVQQYKSGRKMTSEERELECYTKMWLP